MTATVPTWRYAVPKGWVRFSLGSDRDPRVLMDEVAAVVRTSMPNDVPRDSAPKYRELAQRQLQRAIESAAVDGACGVVIPTERLAGLDPASSIAEVETFLGPDFEIIDLVNSARSEGWVGADVVMVDNSEAARLVGAPRLVKVDDGDPVWAHQVAYVVGLDQAAGHWLMLNYSLLAASESAEVELTQALVMLFDAIMTTFRVDAKLTSRSPVLGASS